MAGKPCPRCGLVPSLCEVCGRPAQCGEVRCDQHDLGAFNSDLGTATERKVALHLEVDQRLSVAVAEAIAREIEAEGFGGECSAVYDRCAAIARRVGQQFDRPPGGTDG